MKIIITIFLGILYSNVGYSQTFKLYSTENIHNQLKLNTKTGEVYQIQDDGQKFLVNESITIDNQIENRYTLYKTKNMWTFILVDQFFGKLFQLQYSVQDNNRGISIINSTPLSNSEIPKFTIQPLTSMFQFYLLNGETGEIWKFQWSTKGNDYRWIEKQ